MLDLANRLYTVADIELERVELIHGELVEKMPTEQHGTLAARLAYLLLSFIIPRQIKAHVGVEIRHQDPHDPYNSRIPDVSLRLSEAEPIEEGAVPTMPDLAIEIKSPKDEPREMREKAHYYLLHGARLVWLVYPSNQQVEVCQLDSDGDLSIQPLHGDDLLLGAPVLPDFNVQVKTIFYMN